MNEENQKRILAAVVLGLITLGMFYMYNIINTGWNEYWFERFESNQCKNICEKEGMTLGMQSPSYCQCLSHPYQVIADDGTELTDWIYQDIRRPYTFKDNMVIMFGGGN